MRTLTSFVTHSPHSDRLHRYSIRQLKSGEISIMLDGFRLDKKYGENALVIGLINKINSLNYLADDLSYDEYMHTLLADKTTFTESHFLAHVFQRMEHNK